MLTMVDGLHNGFRVEIWDRDRRAWALVAEFALDRYTQALGCYERWGSTEHARLVIATEAVMWDSLAEQIEHDPVGAAERLVGERENAQ